MRDAIAKRYRGMSADAALEMAASKARMPRDRFEQALNDADFGFE